MVIKIETTQRTFLKPTTDQSSELKELGLADKVDVLESDQSYELLHCSTLNDHYYVVFDKAPVTADRGFIWQGAANVEMPGGAIAAAPLLAEDTGPGSDPQVQPEDPDKLPAVPKPLPTFRVPGISVAVNANTPIWAKGRATNFTWGEATKNGQRIPVSSEITQNIITVADYMEGIRDRLGKRPIGITSWYRDPVTNRAVGGATRSEHLRGNAVDFYVVGEDVVTTFNKLKGFVKGGGYAIGNGFLHVDLRGWDARWHYPNGPKVALW